MAPIESPESSSPIVTRAIAAGLRDEYIDNYSLPGWQKLLLNTLGALPQAAARFVISRFESFSGLDPTILDHFSLDDLIHERLNDYAQSAVKFPVMVMGASLSGAVTYLSLSLGGLFLPQAFVMTLKHGAKSGNVQEYLHRSMDQALRIADSNPGLMTIQHYDPVHDGWMTRFVNHVRCKLLDLPAAYQEFIRARLEPGGAVVYLEGGATWLRYRLGPRSVFQMGGWGAITPEEFLEGSDRLRAYARKSGLAYTDWKLPDYPLERGPESEWGSEPGLGEALERFCRQEQFRFIRISLPHPHDFSRLAFSTAEKLIEDQGETPAGVLVEMFSQFDATSARQGGLLPLWLVFNTEDSRQFLQEMTPRFPAGKPVFFSPLSTFSMTPDLVPFKKWEEVLQGHEWINIGARRSHYPADARALVHWADPLREWVREHPQPVRGRISAEELAALAQDL